MNQNDSPTTGPEKVNITNQNGNDVHIHLRLDRGQRVHITLESEPVAGRQEPQKTPQKTRIKPRRKKGSRLTPWLQKTWHGLKGFVLHLLEPGQETTGRPPYKRLAVLLFWLGLAIYLLTRLISLPNFPIFFFTDEAIQTQLAADFVRDGFRNYDDIFLPTYFENGGQYNLSLSVYAQVLPYLILGKSVWVTRGVSVLLTLIAAISLGLILRDHVKSRFWWLGPLLLAVVPAWFLHSRTAFETVIMASMYAGFLYFYLRYRANQPKLLFPALVFGALAFYAYSPGQVIMVVTGVMLLIADAPYHWKHRKTALIGLGVLVLLALPFIRFSLTQGEERLHHLTVLNSYWVKPISLGEKLLTYFGNYLKGFNPVYWFWPNPSIIERFWPTAHMPAWLFSNKGDLDRHVMKGYGHILLITFPFWVIGLIHCIRKFRDPAHRTLLLATLAAPSGAAIADWGITRGMVFVIPTTLITAIGLECSLDWLQRKWSQVKYPLLAGVLFIVLTFISIWMLSDALSNGPTWYEDYGLGGLQYGGPQVFTRVAEIARENPDTTIRVSSTWANAPDVVMRYFTNDLPNVRMGNINAWGLDQKPLDRDMLFVMTGEDLSWVQESGKFTNISIEETIDYPNGQVGFFFVRLDYMDDIETILEEERTARQVLLEDTIEILGQTVSVQYPTLDMNEIVHAFDEDTTTLIRTLEANPLRLILTFPEPVEISSLTLWIGGAPSRVTATAAVGGEKLETVEDQADRSTVVRDVTLTFSETHLVDTLNIEVLNSQDGEIAHVHLWEVEIK
jgi:hypothetical protein